MCFYSDGDYPEFYTDAIRRARKDHRCAGCKSGIRPGELYRQESWKFDGAFFSTNVCGACELDRHRIHITELADGCHSSESWCPPEELTEYVSESGMERSSRESGQRWLLRKLQNDGYGIGTKRGWVEWYAEKNQQVGVPGVA